MFHSFFPTYFEWWHIPVIFLAGLIGESYGCLIGGGSIVLLATQNFLGVPLKSAIAMNNAAALGTEFGILSETHKQVVKKKRLVLFMMLPLSLGAIVGTWLLLTISAEVIKYLMIIAVVVLLFHAVAKDRAKPKFITKSRYALLFIFLFLTGLYSNFISLGGGTFAKFAVISVLGLTFIQGQGLTSAASVPARVYALVVTAIAGLIVWPYVITFWIATFTAGKYATRFVKHIPDIYLRISQGIICIGFILYLLFFY